MRIVFVVEAYYPLVGGGAFAVQNIAKVLMKMGHHISIVADRYSNRLPRREVIDQATVYRVWFIMPTTEILLTLKSIWRFISLLCLSPVLLPVNLFRSFKILHSERPEVVNVHYLGRNAFYALILRKLMSFKLIINIIGFDIERYRISSFISRSFIKTALKHADKILSYNQDLLSKADAICPGVLKKSAIVGQGINPNEFASCSKHSHPRPYILSIGIFRHRKGFDLLLHAFAMAHKTHPEIDLILAGDGEERLQLEGLVQQLRLGNRVLFYGLANRSEVGNLLKGCEFLVLPSRQESWGLVILEAMLAGKTVVATRVGGIPEYVSHKENGYLVEPESPEALTKGISVLLDDLPLRRSLEKKASEMIPGAFAWDKVAERYLANFLKL